MNNVLKINTTDEITRNRMTITSWQEREDQEESNIPSRKDEQEDTDWLSELESSAMRMT